MLDPLGIVQPLAPPGSDLVSLEIRDRAEFLPHLLAGLPDLSAQIVGAARQDQGDQQEEADRHAPGKAVSGLVLPLPAQEAKGREGPGVAPGGQQHGDAERHGTQGRGQRHGKPVAPIEHRRLRQIAHQHHGTDHQREHGQRGGQLPGPPGGSPRPPQNQRGQGDAEQGQVRRQGTEPGLGLLEGQPVLQPEVAQPVTRHQAQCQHGHHERQQDRHPPKDLAFRLNVPEQDRTHLQEQESRHDGRHRCQSPAESRERWGSQGVTEHRQQGHADRGQGQGHAQPSGSRGWLGHGRGH